MSMRIELGAALKAYQTGKAQQPARPATAGVAMQQQQAANTDTLSISGRGLQDSALTKQAQKMALDIEAQGAPARLDALAQQVARGEYRVSSDTLADLLLGGESI